MGLGSGTEMFEVRPVRGHWALPLAGQLWASGAW